MTRVNPVLRRELLERFRRRAVFLFAREAADRREECLGITAQAVGRLAGGIAHDLNNVLAPVIMATELLQEEVSSDMGRTMIETIRDSANRGSDLVKQILSFARGASGEPLVLQLRHLIRDMAKLVQDTFPRSIQVASRAPNNLQPILGDATQLHQVLLNLCVNARDAMPNGGMLRIEADTVALAPHVLSMLVGVNDFWHKLTHGYTGTVEDYENRYTALLEATRHALPRARLLVLEPFVLRCGAVDDRWFPEFDARRAAAARVARHAGVVFVPLQKVFDDLSRRAPPEYWAADGVHPTPAGHAVIAERWRKAARL